MEINDIKTGLINPLDEEILVPYYEIQKLCEQIVNDYCISSSNNAQKFAKFAKDYTYFKPHFDFVIFELGYELLHPNLTINSNYKYTLPITKLNDTNLDLRKYNFDSDHARECYVDQNGIQLCLSSNLERHEHLAFNMLNMLMIDNQEIFKLLVLELQENGFDDIFYSNFIEQKLGYLRLARLDDFFYKGIASFNSNKINEIQNSIIEDLACKNIVEKDFINDWSFLDDLNKNK